jgi:heme/copper-type cytochrome/quinol oxidase subunit 2
MNQIQCKEIDTNIIPEGCVWVSENSNSNGDGYCTNPTLVNNNSSSTNTILAVSIVSSILVVFIIVVIVTIIRWYAKNKRQKEIKMEVEGNTLGVPLNEDEN